MKRSWPMNSDYVNKTGSIAGRPVRFVVHDDQSNPQLSVQLASALMTKSTPVMIGPASTGSCNAVLPLVKAAGPAMFCLSPAVDPPPDSYAFGSGVEFQDEIYTAFHYMRERGWKQVGYLNTIDATGQAVEKALNAAATLPENREIKVVANEKFNVGDLSVAAQVARIKAAGAQVMIAWVNGAPAATVLRTVIDSGLDIPHHLFDRLTQPTWRCTSSPHLCRRPGCSSPRYRPWCHPSSPIGERVRLSMPFVPLSSLTISARRLPRRPPGTRRSWSSAPSESLGRARQRSKCTAISKA